MPHRPQGSFLTVEPLQVQAVVLHHNEHYPEGSRLPCRPQGSFPYNRFRGLGLQAGVLQSSSWGLAGGQCKAREVEQNGRRVASRLRSCSVKGWAAAV